MKLVREIRLIPTCESRIQRFPDGKTRENDRPETPAVSEIFRDEFMEPMDNEI